MPPPLAQRTPAALQTASALLRSFAGMLQAAHPASTSYRRFPLQLQPVDGESFASFVLRHAADLGVSFFDYFEASGLLIGRRASSWNSLAPLGFGIGLSGERLSTFSYVTGLPEARITDMMLMKYDGVAFDAQPLDVEDPVSLRRMYVRTWAFFAGSHVCPDCLHENHAAWQLAWKLPWSFACVRHRHLLLDTCPRCRRRIGSGSAEGMIAPACRSRVPVPGRCGNPRADDQSGRHVGTCGLDLTKIRGESVAAWRRLVECQEHLNRVLAGMGGTIVGRPVSSVEYFQELRAICALLFYGCTPDTLGPLPRSATKAVVAYAEARDKKTWARRVQPRKGEKSRLSTQYYLATPRSAALMAAVLPTAVQLLSSPSLAALSSALEPHLDPIHRQHRQIVGTCRNFHFSPDVESAIRGHYRSSAKFTYRAGIDVWSSLQTRNKRRIYRYEPRHVPQLLWRDWYVSHFHRLVPRLGPRTMRRFCSLVLVKACGQYTWNEAAALLHLPLGLGRAEYLIGRLRQSDRVDVFIDRIHQTARWLEAAAAKVDYGARRQALVNLRTVPRPLWQDICRQVGVSPVKRKRLRRSAAAWMWCYLTGGDYYYAPPLQGADARRAKGAYHGFVWRALRDFQTALIAYGERLLRAFHAS